MSYVAGRFPCRLLMPALSLAGLLLATGAQAQTYSIADLGTLGGAFNISSVGISINAGGQVTGYSVAGGIQAHAFRTTTPGKAIDAGNDLGTLGGIYSYGSGINASGQITGDSQLLNTAGHAFRTTATGKVSDPGTDLGTLGGSFSLGRAINDSGQVTGYSKISGANADHAFRTTATGKVSDAGTDLGTLGGTDSHGLAINASGQITGYSDIVGNIAHAFRTTATGTISDGTAVDLGSLGSVSPFSVGNSINDSGQVTGYSYTDSGEEHAFRTTATGLVSDAGTDLGTLGGTMSDGYSINSGGQVVGYAYTTGDLVSHAFLYTTSMVDLNSLLSAADQANWELLDGLGINDNGQITGVGIINGEDHAFLLTLGPAATPEPGVWGLFAAAATLGLTLRRRRRSQK